MLRKVAQNLSVDQLMTTAVALLTHLEKHCRLYSQ